jgi:aryl-alcohol dehydrogenase-like predicted oxidoreductase
VSTIILGASRVEQLHENFGAEKVAAKLNPKVMGKIEKIFGIAKDEDDD